MLFNWPHVSMWHTPDTLTSKLENGQLKPKLSYNPNSISIITIAKGLQLINTVMWCDIHLCQPLWLGIIIMSYDIHPYIIIMLYDIQPYITNHVFIPHTLGLYQHKGQILMNCYIITCIELNETSQINLPRVSTDECPRKTFTGTIRGFCIKSLIDKWCS